MKSFAEAIAEAKVDVVPRVMIGATNGQSGSLAESLLAMLMSDKLGDLDSKTAAKPEIEALRLKYLGEVNGKTNGKPAELPKAQ